ncbi:hypothetical protein GDO78_002630 [Eleutherodactylus coqui]|uniref:Uncharacterized protein n=1 Tax=Eleutherodactylus coqui TaxID=57060 RepID=A0A8J6K6M6_ELECQ|nr:hypothetical protein GDO78_002630 [Eleutherodactylus coqui]
MLGECLISEAGHKQLQHITGHHLDILKTLVFLPHSNEPNLLTFYFSNCFEHIFLDYMYMPTIRQPCLGSTRQNSSIDDRVIHRVAIIQYFNVKMF